MLLRRSSAWLAAAALFGCAAPGALATAPPLRGAATHPLWSSSSVATSDRELDAIVAAGANSVRIDIGWSTLQPEGEGTINTAYRDRADTFFAHARERGLTVVVTFWTTPCWASSAPDNAKQGCTGAWWDRGVDRYPPSDPADYASAAAYVAGRWGGDIEAIEVWNEPNESYFFQSAAPAADYASLLKAAYGPIKQADPGLTVLGPAMLWSDRAFLTDLYDRGIQPYEDGISLRPFSGWRSPYDTSSSLRSSFIAGVPDVRQLMVARGDAAKKIWFTELGWGSCAPTGTHSWCVTQDQQAQFIGDAFRIIRDRWDFVEAALVYNLRNKGANLGSLDSQWGMLYPDFTPKPAWGAFTDAMADLAANPDSVPLPPPPLPPPAEGVAEPEPLPPTPADAEPGLRTPPVLTRLAVSPGTLRGSRARLSVAFSVSERASVAIGIERLRGGRRVRALSRSAAAGPNRVSFRPRLGPGRYRLVARPSAAGYTGGARRVRFVVARARRLPQQ